MFRILVFFSLVYVLLPGKVFAENEQGIKIDPAFKEVVIDSTESEKDIEVSIENLTDEVVQLSLSAIDFRQANEYGGIDFLGADSKSYSYSLASFISFETTSITLSAREKQVLNAKIINRPDLSPGGHYAAIVGQLVNTKSEDRSAVVRPAISSLILVKKTGGEVFSLSLLRTNWPRTFMFGFPNRTLQILFQNEGNIHVIPYGTVELKDIFGNKITSGSINNSSSIIFPESRRWIDVNLDKFNYFWPISFVTMDINGRDSIDKTTFVYQQTAVLISPAGIGILIIIIIAAVYFKRKSHGKNKE